MARSAKPRHAHRRPREEPSLLDGVLRGGIEIGNSAVVPRGLHVPSRGTPERPVQRRREHPKGVEEEEEEDDARYHIPFYYGSIRVGHRRKGESPRTPETEAERYRSEQERYKAVTAKYQKGIARQERRRASQERRRTHAEMGTSPMGMARGYLERRVETKREKLKAKTARYEAKTAEVYARMTPGRVTNVSVQQQRDRAQAEIRHAQVPARPMLPRKSSEFTRLEDEG